MEKIVKPMSGYLAFVLTILTFLAGVYAVVQATSLESSGFWAGFAVVLFIAFIFLAKGIMIINPNHSRVLTFFGKYVGSVKQNGLLWVNPLYRTQNISLRSYNLNGQT